MHRRLLLGSMMGVLAVAGLSAGIGLADPSPPPRLEPGRLTKSACDFCAGPFRNDNAWGCGFTNGDAGTFCSPECDVRWRVRRQIRLALMGPNAGAAGTPETVGLAAELSPHPNRLGRAVRTDPGPIIDPRADHAARCMSRRELTVTPGTNLESLEQLIRHSPPPDPNLVHQAGQALACDLPGFQDTLDLIGQVHKALEATGSLPRHFDMSKGLGLNYAPTREWAEADAVQIEAWLWEHRAHADMPVLAEYVQEVYRDPESLREDWLIVYRALPDEQPSLMPHPREIAVNLAQEGIDGFGVGCSFDVPNPPPPGQPRYAVLAIATTQRRLYPDRQAQERVFLDEPGGFISGADGLATDPRFTRVGGGPYAERFYSRLETPSLDDLELSLYRNFYRVEGITGIQAIHGAQEAARQMREGAAEQWPKGHAGDLCDPGRGPIAMTPEIQRYLGTLGLNV